MARDMQMAMTKLRDKWASEGFPNHSIFEWASQQAIAMLGISALKNGSITPRLAMPWMKQRAFKPWRGRRHPSGRRNLPFNSPTGAAPKTSRFSSRAAPIRPPYTASSPLIMKTAHRSSPDNKRASPSISRQMTSLIETAPSLSLKKRWHS